jgi:23S rRNA (guanine2445-N2)-methyltransferase / 23S rRNA (guanine2069-N7)-methyltransferase
VSNLSLTKENLDWLATCPKGMEQLLSDELLALGATEVKQTVAAVHFQGELKIAYKACLW